VRQEERDAHERDTLAEAVRAAQVLVPMWNVRRHAMEHSPVPLWNASSNRHERTRVTTCGIKPGERAVKMARAVH
jgi:hypothetical protein